MMGGFLDFDPPATPIEPVDPIEQAALNFHAANPHVFQELVDLCLLVKRKGRQRWGMKAAFEVLRYNRAVSTEHKTYKLSNNFTAHYARWIMRDVPELAGFFVTRDVGHSHDEYDEV